MFRSVPTSRQGSSGNQRMYLPPAFQSSLRTRTVSPLLSRLLTCQPPPEDSKDSLINLVRMQRIVEGICEILLASHRLANLSVDLC